MISVDYAVHLGCCGAGLGSIEPPSRSESSWGKDFSPVLEGFVQPLEVLVLGVVVKLSVASLVNSDHEHIV